MSGFTKTGEVVIEAGLDQDGDMAWTSHYDGMNPLEVIGALVIVGIRVLIPMVTQGRTKGGPDAE